VTDNDYLLHSDAHKRCPLYPEMASHQNLGRNTNLCLSFLTSASKQKFGIGLEYLAAFNITAYITRNKFKLLTSNHLLVGNGFCKSWKFTQKPRPEHASAVIVSVVINEQKSNNWLQYLTALTAAVNDTGTHTNKPCYTAWEFIFHEMLIFS